MKIFLNLTEGSEMVLLLRSVNVFNDYLSKKIRSFYQFAKFSMIWNVFAQWWWLSCSAVASSTRDPLFESQHRQNFIYQLYIEIEETKIKKKRPVMAHL